MLPLRCARGVSSLANWSQPASTAASRQSSKLGKPSLFEHSLLLNKFDQTQIDKPIKDWMQSGFVKPGDLARKSKITEKTADLSSVLGGLRRSKKHVQRRYSSALLQPVVKEGTIEKEYNWLVLAREGSRVSNPRIRRSFRGQDSL